LKKSLLMAVAVLLIAGGANAATLVSDDFSYADGPLVGNGTWAAHSPAAPTGDFLVASGQAVVTHGAPADDVHIPFVAPAGDIYFALDFSVDALTAPGWGTDSEYFAHFKDDGNNFAARMDIVPPSSGGDYSVGIASDESTADATWPTDLVFGDVYRVVVRFNQADNIAQLWIDPTTPGDASILGEDRADPGDTITQFAMRQSDSDENETVRVDNLVVGTTCDDVFSDCPVAIEAESWGAVKSLYR